MINDTKGPNEDHKKTERRNPAIITRNFMEMVVDMVNKNIQETKRNSKKPKLKDTRRHRNK
jgi:hypothetical protein